MYILLNVYNKTINVDQGNDIQTPVAVAILMWISTCYGI